MKPSSAAAIGLGSEPLKTILVATDFSQDSVAACDWAVNLARAHKARIVLVHAIETELPALAVPPAPLGRHVEQSLRDACKQITACGVDAAIEHHVDKPWKVVPTVAAKLGAELIVLGARGKTNLAGKLLGSTADRIIRTTSVPVVVVRGEPRRPSAIESVLVACDFSEESARALTTAVRLIRQPEGNIRLLLLHVIGLQIAFPDATLPAIGAAPQLIASDPQYWQTLERQAALHLETLAAPVRSEGCHVEVKTVRGLPSEEILREAKAFDAQLIVIGTQGRGGLNRFFMGSVAEWVLHHAECPVLAVRKPDRADVSLSTAT